MLLIVKLLLQLFVWVLLPYKHYENQVNQLTVLTSKHFLHLLLSHVYIP